MSGKLDEFRQVTFVPSPAWTLPKYTTELPAPRTTMGESTARTAMMVVPTADAVAAGATARPVMPTVVSAAARTAVRVVRRYGARDVHLLAGQRLLAEPTPVRERHRAMILLCLAG